MESAEDCPIQLEIDFFVTELIVLLIPSETDMPLGALHVLDDGVDRGTMRSGFISPHPVSFKAGTLVTYSHPPPPLGQPRQQPAVGSEPRLQSLTGRSTAAMEGEPAEGEKPPNNPPTTCDT